MRKHSSGLTVTVAVRFPFAFTMYSTMRGRHRKAESPPKIPLFLEHMSKRPRSLATAVLVVGKPHAVVSHDKATASVAEG